MDMTKRRFVVLGDAYDDYMKSQGSVSSVAPLASYTNTQNESWVGYAKDLGRDAVKYLFTPPQQPTTIYKETPLSAGPSYLVPVALIGVAAVAAFALTRKRRK